MRKITLLSMVMVQLAITVLFAQTYPDPGTDLAVRGAFFSTTKTINDQTYQANWYSDTQNIMTKDANNLFSFQIFLPWSQDGSTAFTYYYTDVFKGQGTTGPRQTGNRKFTLAQDRTVNFYAKAWYNTASAIYQTQMICDAQKVSFLFYGVTGFTAFTQELPLPTNGKSFTVVSLPSVASKIEYNVYDESTVSAPYAWADLNNNATNYKQTLFSGSKGGRYKLAVDYTTISASTAKVLDSIGAPKIKVGTGALILPTDAAFSGNSLGTFNNGTPLTIGGALNAYSLNSAVNVADVSAKIYYQITSTGYDSGVKELVLTTTGTTLTNSTFSTSANTNISTGLSNGDYTLKVWYGATCLEDVLLLNNSGSGYSATFSILNDTTALENIRMKHNISIINGTVNAVFERPADIELFSITGQLINHSVAVKEFSKTLNKGIYILSVNGDSQKLIIK